MEEFKPLSSENILKKIEHTGDSLPGTSIEESINRLKHSSKQIEYGSSGSEDIKSEEFDYHFSYSAIEGEPNPSLKTYIDYLKHKLGDISDPASEVESWRRLNSLSIHINDQEIDVLKILPENADIFFCPNSAIDNGIAFKDSRTVAVLGDIASPITFVILLHEMGHIIDYGKLDELGIDKMVDSHPDSDQAENLRSERVASAFALKAIRPYIKDETMRHDVVNYLKYYALKSYNDKAREVVASRKGIRGYVEDQWGDYENIEAQEDENRREYDIWQKWKDTEKYKEWKALPEYKDVDEYDEPWMWRQWVEKTGCDFWKDIPEDENKLIKFSPIRDAYILLGAKTPLELSNLYSAEDQRLMKSHEWDYKNPDLVINKVKNILESVDNELLTDDEQEWKTEILWFWYHHAISTAIALYKDIDSAKEFSEKALQHQSYNHPNKITRLLNLLVNDKLDEAEEWTKTIDSQSVESSTAQDLIDNYKTGGALNIVS